MYSEEELEQNSISKTKDDRILNSILDIYLTSSSLNVLCQTCSLCGVPLVTHLELQVSKLGQCSRLFPFPNPNYFCFKDQPILHLW
jgi:hypothetical protein